MGRIFQSTPPARGATFLDSAIFIRQFKFQSTPPARGATIHKMELYSILSISIHAPREGGDIPQTLDPGD